MILKKIGTATATAVFLLGTSSLIAAPKVADGTGLSIQVTSADLLIELQNSMCVYNSQVFGEGSRTEQEDGNIYVCTARVGAVQVGESRVYWRRYGG